jgi:cytochrome c biogenesis protein CcdA
MFLLVTAFLAGVLTVLAPCILMLLPVILSGSLAEKDRFRPLVIVASLGVSVIFFSLLLKGTTLLIDIPNEFWTTLSSGILFFFGLTLLFPQLWTALSLRLDLHRSDALLHKSARHENRFGAVLLGAALGPVFTTCSPTYAVILAIILPSSFMLGVLNLAAYSMGLALVLLFIAYGGQSVVQRFRFAANPHGWFKKILGLLLVATSLAIFTGFDKTLETLILDGGYLGPIQLEEAIQIFFAQ